MALTKIDDRGLKTPIDLLDNEKIRLGTGNDLAIWHSGSHSYIEDSGTGSLYIDSNQLYLRNADTDNVLLYTTSGGEVRINHNGNTKIKTLSTGIDVTGTLTSEHTSGNVGYTLHANGNSLGSQIKLHNDHGVAYVGQAGDTTGSLLVWNESNTDIKVATNNTERLRITSGGVVNVPDNGQFTAGSSNDLSIYHNGSHSYVINTTGQFIIGGDTIMFKDGSNTEVGLKYTKDGDVKLYYDDGLKVQTTSYGIGVTGTCFATSDFQLDDGCAYKAGTGDDLQIYHQSDQNYIASSNGRINLRASEVRCEKADGSEVLAKFIADGACELRYNDTVRFETNNYGAKVNGHLYLDDSHKINLGDSQDLEIYHDGSNSYIKNNTNALTIQGAGVYINDVPNGKTSASFDTDGKVELYYNNSKKIETTDGGYKWYGQSNGNATFTYDNTTSNNNRHAEYRYDRSGSSRGLCSVIYIGENSSSQGEVLVYSSGGNANVSGGVRLVDGATSWSAISDMRLKDKTADITNALTDIAKIEPIKFTWKADTDKKPQVGVSAQSVENVVPEAVAKSTDPAFEKNGDNTEYLSVKYTELIPLCIAAIKELSTKVAALEAT